MIFADERTTPNTHYLQKLGCLAASRPVNLHNYFNCHKTIMSTSFEPNQESDYIPQSILLTGGAGKCGDVDALLGYEQEET